MEFLNSETDREIISLGRGLSWHIHSLAHNLQDHLCSWSRRVSGVTFCQLPESCCFWSLSPADVMWFFLPAHSPASANLGHPALISLAVLPLGEKHLVLPQAAVISWQPRLPRHLSASFGVRFKALTSFHRQKLPLNCYRSKSTEHVN